MEFENKVILKGELIEINDKEDHFEFYYIMIQMHKVNYGSSSVFKVYFSDLQHLNGCVVGDNVIVNGELDDEKGVRVWMNNSLEKITKGV